MKLERASKRPSVWFTVVAIIIIVVVLGLIFRQQIVNLFLQPTNSSVPIGTPSVSSGDIKTVVDNINTPWGIAFLPNGELFVTERSGQVQRIGDTGQAYTIAGVRETSEGGLLGIALHPNFQTNRFVYLYSTTEAGGELTNRVERYSFDGTKFSDRIAILVDIPASTNHDGGALAFGPDGKLYVTTGDAGREENAQDRESLAGKILRLNDNGSVPSDNPFQNEIWSYGHRNPQGLAWDDKGRLWSTEHGPSGTESGHDELNLIEKGANYGWPRIRGAETQAGMKTPVAQSGNDDTWAPGGLAFAEGSLYFAGLRGQSLYQAMIEGDDQVSLSRHFVGEYGRLRAVAVRDKVLYFSTSNRDGRGSPAAMDDRIFKISAETLQKK